MLRHYGQVHEGVAVSLIDRGKTGLRPAGRCQSGDTKQGEKESGQSGSGHHRGFNARVG